MFRFFFDAQTVAVLIKLCHTIALRVFHPIAEYSGFLLFLSRTDSFLQQGSEAGTLEDVVAQYQTGTVIANEVGSDGECLSKAVGRWLLSVCEVYTIIASVA